jgi:hypothetical protein
MNVELSLRLRCLRIVTFITGITSITGVGLVMQVEVNGTPASAPTLATVRLLSAIGLWDQGEGHHVRFRHGSLLRL